MIQLLFPGLTIKVNAGVVLRDGQPVRITYAEFSMPCHLARHPGIILSRDQLYTAVYGEDSFNSNSVSNTICRLRSKIEPDPRETTTTEFVAYTGERRKPGTGCISQIEEQLWEGKYSPERAGW